MGTGAIDAEDLAHAVVPMTIESAVRIFPEEFRKTPLGLGNANNRFAVHSSPYQVLFLAEDFETSFLEVLVRDRLVGTSGARELPRGLGELSAYSEVSTSAGERLRLLDLRGDGCHRIRVPTDTVRGMDHAPGRALGQRIYDHHQSDLDGILFHSRHNERRVYAVFSWAVDYLVAGKDQGLVGEHPDTLDIMAKHRLLWRV